MGIDGSPSAHAKGGSRIAPSLRRGLGYLALDPDDTVSSFLRLLAEAHTPFLWLTTERPQAPAEGGEVLRVTTIRGAGTADPRRLQDIRAAATTFFDERGPGALVIDCLIVFANPRETNRRMIAWLERELDPLPKDVEPAGVEDHLVV